MLSPVGEELWTVEGPILFFYSFPYPTRMAVARLAKRQLWLWSPIALTSELAEELEKLGEVRHLVAPNRLHHLFLTELAEQYPGARLYAAPGLAKKRRDLTFSAELGNEPPSEWQDEIDQTLIGGSFAMNEVVFFHRPSRSALVCDLIQKHDKSAFSGWRRWAMQLDGMVGPHGSTPREWRATFTNRAVARAGRDTMLDSAPAHCRPRPYPSRRCERRHRVIARMDWVEAMVSQRAMTRDTRHASAESSWYDQSEHEWVIILSGRERLRYEDEDGEVERSHRTDKDEFYQLLTYRDDVDLEKRLAVWERFYNFDRPHGAHGGKTPYEALREKLA